MSIAEKLQTIAENEQKVYDKGFELGTLHGYDKGSADGYSQGYGIGVEEGYSQGHTAGKTEGKTEGYNEGVQAEYDRFWDAFQSDTSNRVGERYDYTSAFYKYAWTDKTYNPKWDFGMTETVDGKTVKRIETASNMFFQSQITDTLKPIDFTMDKYKHTSVFSYTNKLKTIRTLTVSEGVTYKDWFQNCSPLENITFEGVIGQDIDFKWSTKLSKDSITNIIEHLSTTASGKTLTLSKTAVNTAFNMTDGNPSTEWSNLVGTKQNWNISLV